MNPLIDKCPNNPTLAAAYMRGAEVAINEFAKLNQVKVVRGWFRELARHVPRLMRDYNPPAPDPAPETRRSNV